MRNGAALTVAAIADPVLLVVRMVLALMVRLLLLPAALMAKTADWLSRPQAWAREKTEHMTGFWNE